MGTKQTALNLLVIFLTLGCAKERPTKSLVENSLRVPKAKLAGTYSYLRTITDSKYTATDPRDVDKPKAFLPAGLHMNQDVLVQFVIKSDTLEVTSVDPLYNSEATAKYNSVLLSFPVKHVDVLRKQNPDGTDTHEEEETSTRRACDQRDYLIVDTAQNKAEISELGGVKLATPIDGFSFTENSINFSVEKTLESGTVITERYSFLKFEPSKTYVQKTYPKELQSRFGLFKTRTYKFDKFGRALNSLVEEMVNRWDTNKPVVYYLSPGFPEHLKAPSQAIFAAWNEAFKKAVGHDVLELRENTGQQVGDLRYSMVVYNEANESNGLLGYGPSVANPRTGEIIKADVNLYGGSLLRAVHREKEWLNTEKVRKIASLEPPKASNATLVGRIANFLSDPLYARVNLAASFSEVTGMAEQALATARTQDGTVKFSELVNFAKSTQLARGIEYTTPLGDATMSLVGDLTAASLSDDEIEVRVFGPLLAHELGHTLGLRHNFMGSADEKHFPTGSKSSSVMDYGFLSTEETMGPGPYDIAAIEFGYSDTSIPELGENFLFCTDEHVFDPRQGTCLQHDIGSSLTAIAENQRLNYFKSHRFNNQRNDRVQFPLFKEYLMRVLRSLIPLRIVYDHSNSIVTNGRAYSDAPTEAPTNVNDFRLWSLLKLRIEADSNSKTIRSIRINTTRTIHLDVDKIGSAVKDAVSARLKAFEGLRDIIMDNNPERPNHNRADWEFDELVVRGVIMDKIYALLFLMMPTSDPTGGGGVVSVFDEFHKPMSTMLSDLISNTSLQGGLQIGSTDVNLRHAALDFIEIFSQVPTISTGELLQLIQLKPVVGVPETARSRELEVAKAAGELENLRQQLSQAILDSQANPTPENQQRAEALQKQVTEMSLKLSRLQLQLSVGIPDEDYAKLLLSSDIRSEMVELIFQMEVNGPTPENQQKFGELFKQLRLNNIAQIQVADGSTLKAPLTFSTFGEVETASGRLLFFNLNLIEMRARVIKELLPIIEIAIALSPTEKEKEELNALRNQLLEQSLLYERYIALEKRFVQRLYSVYR